MPGLARREKNKDSRQWTMDSRDHRVDEGTSRTDGGWVTGGVMDNGQPTSDNGFGFPRRGLQPLSVVRRRLSDVACS